MELALRGKNIELTEALRNYVEKKVGKIDKYFDIPLRAEVTLNVEGNRHIVEVTLPVDGMLLRGEAETQDMYAAVDAVVKKIERQIHKYKTKINRKARQTGNSRKPPIIEEFFEEEEEEDEEPRIVRYKRISLKPMSEEEAVLQMNLLDHDFFVFRHAQTGDVNVVYRRKDGNYGLIGPNV